VGPRLPPLLFYALGAFLVIAGALRAYVLGWQRREEQVPGDEDLGDKPQRPSQARRHITFGVVWLVMGLFLIISTYLNSRR
jgi:hypothetical protein